MTIQYASDLHLEFRDNEDFINMNPIEPQADILLLAGDVALRDDRWLKKDFFLKLSKEFEKVYMVPGNHEFYNASFPIKRVLPSFEYQIAPNIQYLNNRANGTKDEWAREQAEFKKWKAKPPVIKALNSMIMSSAIDARAAEEERIQDIKRGLSY